jgi:thiamine biosynthesis protein ThiI
VAAYLVGRSLGVEVSVLHLDNFPLLKETGRLKALRCWEKLKRLKVVGEAYVLPHSHSLLEFYRKCERRLVCVLCRRQMLRVAEKLAEELSASALVTGESLGQVASQTLANIAVEDQAVKLPVLRPLIGFNKEEIVAISKQIGTYLDSIIPGGCCANPRKPATQARLEKVLEEEAKLNLEAMTAKSLAGKKVYS